MKNLSKIVFAAILTLNAASMFACGDCGDNKGNDVTTEISAGTEQGSSVDAEVSEESQG